MTLAAPSAPQPRFALPDVRGTYRFDAPLAPTNWFRVGGNAEVLFKPEDAADLQHFLAHLDPQIPVTVLGVGSNVIVRDGGIGGVVIKLGRGFTELTLQEDILICGAACMDVHVARFAADHGRAGLEFLVGIPGTMGGALAMNAGAYGREIKDVLIACEAIDRQGKLHRLTVAECRYSYRHFGGKDGLIFTRAFLATEAGTAAEIHAQMDTISAAREATQPVRSRTGGSTFANPEGAKAWQLIDDAGCRGLVVGDAEISHLHCNFMINRGVATASDLETLGERVRAAVLKKSGVALQWEIKRIGDAPQERE